MTYFWSWNIDLVKLGLMSIQDQPWELNGAFKLPAPHLTGLFLSISADTGCSWYFLHCISVCLNFLLKSEDLNIVWLFLPIYSNSQLICTYVNNVYFHLSFEPLKATSNNPKYTSGTKVWEAWVACTRSSCNV